MERLEEASRHLSELIDNLESEFLRYVAGKDLLEVFKLAMLSIDAYYSQTSTSPLVSRIVMISLRRSSRAEMFAVSPRLPTSKHLVILATHSWCIQ